MGLVAQILSSNLPCCPGGTDLYPVGSEQHATFKIEKLDSSLTLWYGRTDKKQKNNAWNLEHAVKGVHASHAAMLGYLETEGWPQRGHKWVTTTGFHVTIQVVTLEFFAGCQKNPSPAAAASSLASKLDSFEAKLQGMTAEHAKDTERLADKLHQLTDYVYGREQHHHKNAALQFDHNNYVDDHLNLLLGELAVLRSDVAKLKEDGEAKRRRLEGPACTCEHRPVDASFWLEPGTSCFVKKGGAFSKRFAQGWNRKLGYQLSYDKAGKRLCRQHASSPFILHTCAACAAAT